MTLRAVVTSSGMLLDQILAFGDDLVGILHGLEFLVAVVAVQAHARADDFQHIDDAERPITFVRA